MSAKSEVKKPSLEGRARLFLKAEIKRANLTYEEVAERLKAYDLKESPATIANKLARGTFSATFLLSVLKVIGKETVSMSEIFS